MPSACRIARTGCPKWGSGAGPRAFLRRHSPDHRRRTMRRTITVAVFAAALAATPALAQGNSGNHGPPDGAGGGPPEWAGGPGGPGGNGGGPPIDPPGLSSDPLEVAR